MCNPSASEPTLIYKPQFLSNESYAILLLILSAITFSAGGVFVKKASETGIPSSQLVFIRAIVQGSITVLFMYKYSLIRHPFGKSSQAVRVVLLRGVIGGMGFPLYFYAMESIPLGDAVTLFSLYPIITLFMARIVLGEKMKLTHLTAALASVIGAVIIAGPSFLCWNKCMTDQSKLDEDKSSNQRLGYIAAIIGSFCASCVIVLIRKAGTMNVHTFQLVFSWAVFASTYSLFLGLNPMIREGIMGETPWLLHFPSQQAAMYTLGVVTFGSMAHFMMNYAGKFAPAGLGSIARSSDILWAYGLEVIFLHQVPRQITLIGVALVGLSLCLVAVTHQGSEKIKNSARSKEGAESFAEASPFLLVDKSKEDQDQQVPDLLSKSNYGATDSFEV